MKSHTTLLQAASLCAVSTRPIYDQELRGYLVGLTITNHSLQAVRGPLHILFEKLNWGICLINANGKHSGCPVVSISLPGDTLLPGGTVKAVALLRKSRLWPFARVGYRVRLKAGGYETPQPWSSHGAGEPAHLAPLLAASGSPSGRRAA